MHNRGAESSSPFFVSASDSVFAQVFDSQSILLPSPVSKDLALSPNPSATAPASSGGWQAAVHSTVAGLGYDLVDVERLPRGLLRISIDRVPGHAYATGESEFVTVEDCEAVTKQLQYVLEVEQFDYARLEVSSPGLDRPLRKPADWERFAGSEVEVSFKEPFAGRRKYKGQLLGRQADTGHEWRLVVKEGKTEQALDFNLDEVREARLVPVIDFKGRRGPAKAAQPTNET